MKILATAIGDPEEDYDFKVKLHNQWKSYVKAYNKASSTPASLSNTQFHGDQAMAWAASEREFLRGATSGMFIAIIFSFIILLIATMNIVMALASVLSVAFIVTTVVTVMVLQGW